MREQGTIPAPPPPEAATPPTVPGGHPMEIWISYVLRGGVLTAGAIILLGLAWFLIAGAGSAGPAGLNDIIGNGGQAISVTPVSIARGIAQGDPIAIIQLGVLVLILTPIMRVAMTVLLFVAQRDRIFVAITAIVFAILLLGLVGVGS